MACIIEILEPVIGYFDSSGQLASILVTGRATCDIVQIEIDCGGAQLNQTTSVHDGVWSKLIELGHASGVCACDKPMKITVQCQGGECHDTFFGTLTCQSPTQCPFIYADIDVSADCEQGKRRVTGQVIASASGKTFNLDVTIDGKPVGSGTVNGQQGGSVTINTLVNAGGGKALLTWTPSDPGCAGGGQTIPMPACPGCPDIKIEADVNTGADGCRGGLREVTISAAIPDQGVATTAAITHNGTVLKQDTQTGPFTLSATGLFPSGLNSVTVEIIQPPPRRDCPPATSSFNVDPCPGAAPPPKGSAGGDNGDDDGDGSFGCIIGRMAVVLLFAAAIFLSVLTFCMPPPVDAGLLIAAGAAWTAAVVALVLWSAFCGSRCGRYLIFWQSAGIGAWLAAYLIGCCPAALAAAIGFGVLALVGFIAWVVSCKPTPCRIFLELTWVNSVPAAIMVTAIGKLLPCGMLTDIPDLNKVIGGIFASAALATCVKQATN